MKNDALIVFITAPSPEVGKDIARVLLEKKLAACVNLVPGIQSMYWWEGKIQTDEEVLLLVKTRQELFADGLLPTVRQIHPYDLPEMIAVPIVQGSADYLAWIRDNTPGPQNR